MQKNTASQKWVVFAFQDEGGTNPGEPVTGDAANITANVRIDGGAANAVDDVNPTEMEDGYYIFDITAAESNGDLILIAPVSATANVNVIGVPGALYTTDVQNLVDAALVAQRLDHLAAVADSDDVVDGSIFAKLVSATNDWSTFVPGTDSLEAEATRTGVSGVLLSSSATSLQLVDDIWNELRSGHTTAGTFGQGVASVQGNVTGSVGSVTGNVSGSTASVTGAVGSVSGNVGGSVASVTGAVGSVTGNVGGSVASVTAQVTADVTAVNGVAASAANLEASVDTAASGTASGTPTTTTMVSNIGVTVDDQFNGRTILFASDTTTAALRKQGTDITACTAATNTLTFTALTTAPVSGDTFVIV